MSEPTKRKHASKRLLVAAIGVATVSYVSTQSGCAVDGADGYDDEASESAAAYDDESEAELAASEQALAVSAAAQTAIKIKVRPKFPPVGNLMAPPYDIAINEVLVKTPIKIPVPIPVGNLMAPPPHEVLLEDLATQVRGK